MNWSSIGEIFIGVVAGGLISAYFSWRGSKELRREARNLRLLTVKLMHTMHDAGLIKVEWDKQGNPIRVVEASAIISSSSSMTVQAEVKRHEDKPENEKG